MSSLLFGVVGEFFPVLGWCVFLLGYLVVGFYGLPLLAWTIYTFAAFWGMGVPLWLQIPLLLPLILCNLPVVRAALITSRLMAFIKKLNILPEISETEQVALDAGTTWMDKELFSGKPDFSKIQQESYTKVSGDALSFINGSVEKLCSMTTDWEVSVRGDLSKEVWDFIAKERFLGMIIPKEYGGLGLPAIGNSEVVAKLSSRSLPLCLCVMVPNSLGPAELLVHYGTEAQRNYYLPRLAIGEEIPCFALTEPNAGSDAGSISSEAVIFRGEDGKLYLRMNWNKRYITLAAVATLIGLAVKLRDPDNLLGKGEDLGITCVLVPANTPGIQKKQRHNPLGVSFYNCPTVGKDVIVSVDQIIGGIDGAGKGWKMLMECLAAGRSVSLPAQSAGGSKLVLRATSAYATIRKQFGLSIAKFEGIEEPLARIAGQTYLLEAMRIFTVGAVDKGLKPSVVSAIAKYQSTEISRRIINDGMDILGGAGISRGPRNLLAASYIGAPIGITVEGANILTRCMIIFGQGAIRCHPFAYSEMRALMDGNIAAFDKAFFGHIGFAIRNVCRATLLFLTRGRLAKAPDGIQKSYYQKLAWSSATFAILADMALGLYGGNLKFKEKITGRFADILGWMYIITSTLRRFEAEGKRADHLPYFEWSMRHAFGHIQEAFDGIFANISAGPLTPLFRGPLRFIFRVNRFMAAPTDELLTKMVDGVSVPGELRDSLTQGIYIPNDLSNQLALYENAFVLVHQASEIAKRLNKAMRQKLIPKDRSAKGIALAVEAKVITLEEAEILRRAEEVRSQAVQVDAFDLETYEAHLLKTE